ncbi:hypothetical protein CBFG_02236 [Clostridiales bacterium 1_7_47FAA]|nr:hypothetical protein CBFG_02236 [Clostridiales bacterium 1_7_47FAA]
MVRLPVLRLFSRRIFLYIAIFTKKTPKQAGKNIIALKRKLCYNVDYSVTAWLFFGFLAAYQT